MQALAARAPHDPRTRAALLATPEDQNPDLCADAMAAMAQIRALVLTRCEDGAVWEDDGAVWEDWLDVQIACIDALGRMGAADAVPDLLAAQADEFGQTLDAQVFAAFARMGDAGAAQLLAAAQAPCVRAPVAALSALLDGDPRVQAAGVDALPRPLPETARQAVIDNLPAWLIAGGCDLGASGDLIALLSSAAQQVRMEALKALTDQARAGDARAEPRAGRRHRRQPACARRRRGCAFARRRRRGRRPRA